MILYHGSNTEIHAIDLNQSMRGKDFGQGFYLSADQRQAEEMATFKTLQFGGNPIVNAFEFDETLLSNSSLNTKIFDDYSVEWAEFIFKNRNRQLHFLHDYDIVIGPIANDGVAYLLGRYEEGTLSIYELSKELIYKKLNRQYYFGTEKSIKYLKRL